MYLAQLKSNLPCQNRNCKLFIREVLILGECIFKGNYSAKTDLNEQFGYLSYDRPFRIFTECSQLIS